MKDNNKDKTNCCDKCFEITSAKDGFKEGYCDNPNCTCHKDKAGMTIRIQKYKEGVKVTVATETHVKEYFVSGEMLEKSEYSVVLDATDIAETLTAALIDAEIERVEGMKKETHRVVEDKFWFDPTDSNTKGEFELYGEYEPFFHFAKKMRNKALTDHLTHLKEQREIINNI